MDYTNRLDQATTYEYPDEPMQMTIDRLRDVIELQAREIMRLQRAIRELETEHEVKDFVLIEPGAVEFDELPLPVHCY